MKPLKDLDEELFWDLVFFPDIGGLLMHLSNMYPRFNIKNRLEKYYL